LSTSLSNISPRPPVHAQSDQSISHLSTLRSSPAPSSNFQPDRVSVSKMGQQFGAMYSDANKIADPTQRKAAQTSVQTLARSAASNGSIDIDVKELARKNQQKNKRHSAEMELKAKQNRKGDKSEAHMRETAQKGQKDIVEQFMNAPQKIPDADALAKEKPQNMTEKFVAARSEFALVDGIKGQDEKAKRAVRKVGEKLKAESKAKWQQAIQAAREAAKMTTGQKISLAA